MSLYGNTIVFSTIRFYTIFTGSMTDVKALYTATSDNQNEKRSLMKGLICLVEDLPQLILFSIYMASKTSTITTTDYLTVFFSSIHLIVQILDIAFSLASTDKWRDTLLREMIKQQLWRKRKSFDKLKEIKSATRWEDLFSLNGNLVVETFQNCMSDDIMSFVINNWEDEEKVVERILNEVKEKKINPKMLVKQIAQTIDSKIKRK